MDFSNYFTYFSGVASLASFVMQAVNLFPQRKTGFRYASFLFFGIFAGGLINAFDASSIKLDFVITGFYLLAGTMAVVFLVFITIFVFSNSQKKREEYLGVAAMVGFVLLLVIGVRSCDPFDTEISNERNRIANENSKISIKELNLLSEEAIRKENFDRALMHLESIRNRLRRNDVRIKKIEQKMEEVKEKQL